MADPTGTTTSIASPTPADHPAAQTSSIFSGLINAVTGGFDVVEDGFEVVEHKVVDFFHTAPGKAAVASLETAVLAALGSFLPAKLAAGEAAIVATISDAEVQKFVQGILVGVTGIVGTMITEFLSRVPAAPVAPPSTPTV